MLSCLSLRGYLRATRKAKSFSIYMVEVHRELVLVMLFARSSAVVGTAFIEHGSMAVTLKRSRNEE